jgi:polysaccharide export outer membrane protein
MKKKLELVVAIVVSALLVTGCATPKLPEATQHRSKAFDVNTYEYLIGPNDVVKVFVWRHPEVTGTYNVKPDGRITLPLLGDIELSGKTTVELSKELEEKFDILLKSPKVTVTVESFVGSFAEQVRVVGAATAPRAINYSKNMTLLDVMIQVGGLTKYADGNDATLIRNIDGKRIEYNLEINDLLKYGDLSENVDILPGDVIVIPEAWF